MNYWVLCIFRMRPLLETLVSRTEAEIEKAAVILHEKVELVIDRVYSLNDRKRRLVNLAVIYKGVVHNLSDTEKTILKMFSRNVPIDEIVANVNSTRTTFYKKLRAALKKSAEALYKLGYNERKLEADYSDIAVINRIYRRIEKEHVIKLA